MNFIAKAYITRKLKEKSTWVGIAVFIAGCFGTTLSDDVVHALEPLISAVIALYLVIVNEQKKTS